MLTKQLIGKKQAKEKGLKKYYTGKKCHRGHLDFRYVSTSKCVECNKIDQREWAEENPKKKVASSHRSQKNRDKNKKNKELKLWREKNKPYILEYQKKWREDNKSHINQYAKEYRKKRPETKRTSEARRRAAKRGLGNHYTWGDVQRIKASQHCKCASCFIPLSAFHVDHITPLSKGGSNCARNIQILCPSCNLKKNDKDPILWANQNGRLL